MTWKPPLPVILHEADKLETLKDTKNEVFTFFFSVLLQSDPRSVPSRWEPNMCATADSVWWTCSLSAISTAFQLPAAVQRPRLPMGFVISAQVGPQCCSAWKMAQRLLSWPTEAREMSLSCLHAMLLGTMVKGWWLWGRQKKGELLLCWVTSAVRERKVWVCWRTETWSILLFWW